MLGLTQLVRRPSQDRGRVVGECGLNHSVAFLRPAALVGPITHARTAKLSRSIPGMSVRTAVSTCESAHRHSGNLEASVSPRTGDSGPRPQELVCCLDETGRGCSKMISWPGWFDNQGPSWGHTLERLLPSCRIPNPKPPCNQGRCRLARAHDAYVTSQGIAPWGDAHVDGDGFVSLAAKRGELGGWCWAAGSVSAPLRSWSSAIGSAAQDLHDPCRLQLRGLSCMCLDGWSGGVKEGGWHRRRAATTVMQAQ